MALTPIEIKTELLQKGVSITELAARWSVKREAVSRVVHRYGGHSYPEIRRKLAKYLGVPVSAIGREATRKPKKKAA